MEHHLKKDLEQEFGKIDYIPELQRLKDLIEVRFSEGDYKSATRNLNRAKVVIRSAKLIGESEERRKPFETFIDSYHQKLSVIALTKS